ncbi:hypothetical protein BG015_008860 [Linnemannia schmuckeri]|uniref:Uncharacterized protein n=1 Tax=Linnemannia schmuckeri TaxID=64567 RepID=A0A9P5RYG4_9FUNG|nr:hypothetical protein BG015_008860 [Linnemannia schmuckeri]
MSVLLARLRIGIAALILLVIILYAIYWPLYFSSLNANSLALRTLSTSQQLIIADHALLFLIFVYAAVPRFPAKVPRYVRAFVLFVMAVYALYYHLNNLSNVFMSKVFLCGNSVVKNACGVNRAIHIFGTVAGFLIMYENALTLKETDPNPSTGSAVAGGAGGAGGTGGGQPGPNIVPYHLAMQTPPSMQQTYPQQQFQQQGVYYPQQQQSYMLAQQQPPQNATHKLEAPGQAQQQQQFQPQPLYQLTPQQQQQQQFYQPLQPGQQPLQHQQQNPYPQQQQTVTVQPMVPGSLVTTTPQPGGQAIAPYTSSGDASVAVSPVLPAGGYSTPSPSVGHQSPVHPPQ